MSPLIKWDQISQNNEEIWFEVMQHNQPYVLITVENEDVHLISDLMIIIYTFWEFIYLFKYLLIKLFPALQCERCETAFFYTMFSFRNFQWSFLN